MLLDMSLEFVKSHFNFLFWIFPFILKTKEHGSLQDMLLNVSLEFEGEFIHPILQDIIEGMRFLHAAQVHVYIYLYIYVHI